MGTNDEIQDSQKEQTGQVEENQGQPKPETNQPIEVELEDGTRVSVEELRSGYMKDSDYRKKTAELAEERRRLQREQDMARNAYQPPLRQSVEETEEEVDPYQLLAREVVMLKTAYARDYLSREIDKFSAKYPDTDKKAAFAACWSNPNANIEDEVRSSHEAIQAKIAEKAPKGPIPATLEEFFKLNPKAKAEYDKRTQEDYLRKKAQKPAETRKAPESSSAATVREERQKPSTETYSDVTERLKARLKEESDESF